MRLSPVVGLALVAATAVACSPKAPAAPPKPDENAIRAAISAELAKFGPAIDGKDPAALAAIFTDDATWIMPDASTYVGKANIEAGAKSFFASFDSAAMSQISLDKLIVVNDSEAVTFAHGDYTMTMKGKTSPPRVNPVADYWQKGADGVWRVAYEVNADGPAPAAPAVKK